MAKRFIDTNLFVDDWFHDLSKDCKLFFIYFITNCDHAGCLKLNKKLCEFQTGLNSTDTLIKELGNSLVTVREGLYFMPRFIKFQYPNFPKSSVKQQDSALKILLGYKINLNSYLTVKEDLTKSYDNDSVIVYNTISLKKFFEEAQVEQIWIDDSCITTGLNKDQLIKALIDFKNHIKATEPDKKEKKSEWRRYFINWTKSKIDDYKTPDSKRLNGYSTNPKQANL